MWGKAKQHLSVLSWVECEKCGAKTPQYQFDNQSIDAWNNRVSGWIPVSDNPPKDVVIGGDKWGNVEKVYYMSNRKGWFIYPLYCVEMDVIAWQPLPEPYKESIDELL